MKEDELEDLTQKVSESENEAMSRSERRKLFREQEKEEERRGNGVGILRNWLIGLLVIGLLAAGGWWLWRGGDQSSSSQISQETLLQVAGDDWTKGTQEAKATLIEYSDFQCPACATYYPFLKQLNQEFGDKLQFVYRHFPLRQIHRNAELAARASEAAGNQGKFWEMHDMLFENQNKWANTPNPRDQFIEYAQEIGLDSERFKNELDAEDSKDKVENNYQGGLKLKVNATPTFFLNGNKLQNPRNYEGFKNIIQNAISGQ